MVLVSDIVDRVQKQLIDPNGVRWLVLTELIPWLNDGQREIAHRRPDSLFADSVPKSAIPPDVTALTDKLSISEQYRSCLVDYVLFRAFGKDSEDNESLKRSETHLRNHLLQLK